MKRRELLKTITIGSGVSMTLGSFTSLLLSCKNEIDTSNISLSFFDKSVFGRITVLSDIIIPKSDSPSASEVGVPLMMDKIVADVYSEDDRTTFAKRIDALMTYLDEKDFDSQSDASKKDILLGITTSENKKIQKAFNDLRGQCINYYLSAEEISTNELNFLPVPKDYIPCISLNEVNGRAWAY